MFARFVILHHTGLGEGHFDFMLEDGDSLATWQFDMNPLDGLTAAGRACDLTASETHACRLLCKRIQDHRPAYLDYEGPVSRNRGSVRQVEHGAFELIERSGRRWLIRLKGARLEGLFELRPVGPDSWELSRSQGR